MKQIILYILMIASLSLFAQKKDSEKSWNIESSILPPMGYKHHAFSIGTHYAVKKHEYFISLHLRNICYKNIGPGFLTGYRIFPFKNLRKTKMFLQTYLHGWKNGPLNSDYGIFLMYGFGMKYEISNVFDIGTAINIGHGIGFLNGYNGTFGYFNPNIKLIYRFNKPSR